MGLLLNWKGNKVKITEGAVVQIMKLCDQEVIEFLLDRKGSEDQITEGVIIAAVGN